MTELLLDRNLRQSEPYSEVRNLARSQTLTTLRSLSVPRKSSILHFLHEADLIKIELTIIDLSRADLTEATYDASTRWPPGFVPERAGAIIASQFGSYVIMIKAGIMFYLRMI